VALGPQKQKAPRGFMESLFSTEVTSFFMIIVIDLVMSGDNAIIIGMAAAALPQEMRRRAIIYGIAGAAILRILFASSALYLLNIIGLTLAGGLLLAWVCWRMWRELRDGDGAGDLDVLDEEENGGGAGAEGPSEAVSADVQPTMRRAFVNIVVADLSMSLDNVLAVAGAARDHLGLLVFGLVLSIGLMAVASTYIARILDRHHWIAYIGLAIIVYVAGDMIWRGGFEVQTEFLG